MIFAVKLNKVLERPLNERQALTWSVIRYRISPCVSGLSLISS